MLLGRAYVASVFERDPGVACFEQHGQHLAPQVAGLQGACRFDFTAGSLFLVGHIGLLKINAKQIMQIGYVVGREQRPGAFFHYTAHEQIGNPVGRVHVMGAAAVIAGVLAQFQELFNIEVPCFQVGTNRALALTALVDGNSRVIDHLEEGHNALGLAIGAFDVRAQGAYTGPVVTQASGKLGQQGVFFDGLVNTVQIVRHGCQIATGQLRATRTAVEQGRCAGHEVET